MCGIYRVEVYDVQRKENGGLWRHYETSLYREIRNLNVQRKWSGVYVINFEIFLESRASILPYFDLLKLSWYYVIITIKKKNERQGDTINSLYDNKFNVYIKCDICKFM